ncbi:helix-turn-helix transcriptional regulator [Saccharothrix xinjiangensis]|uniref:LuxR C-terminal-related transcriptional regulator n=1 Tax=Saccharothrix xinjiangensis TaxID=204798 RepID=A0ABV9XTV2_9PSEU
MTTTITLTLFNRDEVIKFITGPLCKAREPEDFGSDVVIVELSARRAVVLLGETVTRTETDFVITGRGGGRRDHFPHTAPPALSFSERRVANLAAASLTNAQIAEHLRITPSTVEQHLTRTYRKLGVKRSGLRAALTTTRSA